MSWGWKPYVPVAKRREKAAKKLAKLQKGGMRIEPVEISGRQISASFWGRGWCDHIESFSDYENRIPRGRTYVRNGSVLHLEIAPGIIRAKVSGSELYEVAIKIEKLGDARWNAIKKKCSGQIGSILELLQGRLSNSVMEIVSHRQEGLFPLSTEISLSCSCPDWAVMCKHVAAALYGVGNRLDFQPELLFLLRGVDPSELITSGVSIPECALPGSADGLDEGDLTSIFGVEMDEDAIIPPPRPAHAAKAAAAKTTKANTKPGKPVKAEKNDKSLGSLLQKAREEKKAREEHAGRFKKLPKPDERSDEQKKADHEDLVRYLKAFRARRQAEAEEKARAKLAEKAAAKTAAKAEKTAPIAPAAKAPATRKMAEKSLPEMAREAIVEANRVLAETATPGKAVTNASRPKASAPKKSSPVKTAQIMAPPGKSDAKKAGFVPEGQSILALRKKAGLGVSGFAKKIGVTASTVYRWEKLKGRINISGPALAALNKLHGRFAGK